MNFLILFNSDKVAIFIDSRHQKTSASESAVQNHSSWGTVSANQITPKRHRFLGGMPHGSMTFTFRSFAINDICWKPLSAALNFHRSKIAVTAGKLVLARPLVIWHILPHDRLIIGLFLIKNTDVFVLTQRLFAGIEKSNRSRVIAVFEPKTNVCRKMVEHWLVLPPFLKQNRGFLTP